MTKTLKWAFAAAALTFAAHASADVTFYENENFEGRSFTARDGVEDFGRFGFNDRASSAVVTGSPWEVCDDAGFRGRCMVLRPGNYPSLRAMNMNDRLSSARSTGDRRYGDDRYAPPPPPSGGHITLYENDGFQGRTFGTERDVPNLRQFGYNDRASSAVVVGQRWEVCDDLNFGGRCVVLRPGSYPSLSDMGLNDRLSSVRAMDPGARFDDNRYAPPPRPAYDWRRRPQERLYEVNVSSVRAVMGAQQQRCWVEREHVETRGAPNVGGAVIGGLLGGILGHQIGGGTGRDIATVGGAVGGAVLGANVNRGAGSSTQDVQRCAPAQAQGRPEYWDVRYVFRGVEHRVQATSPPGATITVNEAGEPRL